MAAAPHAAAATAARAAVARHRARGWSLRARPAHSMVTCQESGQGSRACLGSGAWAWHVGCCCTGEGASSSTTLHTCMCWVPCCQTAPATHHSQPLAGSAPCVAPASTPAAASSHTASPRSAGSPANSPTAGRRAHPRVAPLAPGGGATQAPRLVKVPLQVTAPATRQLARAGLRALRSAALKHECRLPCGVGQPPPPHYRRTSWR